MNSINTNNNDKNNIIIIPFLYSGQSIPLIAIVIAEK